MSNSRVCEISKIVLTFFMMSETQWLAVENVVFFSKKSTVIELPVMHVCGMFHVTGAAFSFDRTYLGMVSAYIT